jgi:hypothetical protein
MDKTVFLIALITFFLTVFVLFTLIYPLTQEEVDKY